MISHYYRNVHAVVFVYDVTNRESFDNLTHWIQECKKYIQDSHLVPKILVGNKCDLSSENSVDTHLAQTFADMNQMPLFETSAKDDSKQDHVEAIFMTLALKLKNSKPFFNPNELNKASIQSVDVGNRSNGQNNGDSCAC